ncbi:MAG: HAD-IIA family hydrolase [Deltaproteobacteria bacterium]|nr:HAD-IIA family hydrolase [Deltaproteobacteria bacterium]
MNDSVLKRLKETTFFILDMDGTFYLGDELIRGAPEFLDFIKKRGAGYLFLTNNSSKSPADYARKFRRIGYPVPEENIFTSGEATARFIEMNTSFRRIFLAGTPSLEAVFRNAGFELATEDPDCCVLGFDTTLTYEKLRVFCDLVRRGMPYIATHPDLVCPVGGGAFIPDAGAMIAFIKAAAGREPDEVIGKPNKAIMEMLFDQRGIDAGSAALIGDRLYTDIAAAKNAGILSILPLTGETEREDIEKSQVKPDIVVRNLLELKSLMLD